MNNTVTIFYGHCANFKAENLKIFLSQEELTRANRLVKQKQRQHFIIARGQLRKVLAQQLSLVAQDIQFQTNEYGKPGIANQSQSYFFSLSHSSDYFAIALSSQLDVGLDLEYVNRKKNYQAIAEHFFLSQEVKAIVNRDIFYQYWCAKEATVKALGITIAQGLKNVLVNLAAQQSCYLPTQKNFYLYQTKDIENFQLTCAADEKFEVNFVEITD